MLNELLEIIKQMPSGPERDKAIQAYENMATLGVIAEGLGGKG